MSAVFHHALFLEGYKRVRKYLHDIQGVVLEAGGGTGRYGIQIAADNQKCMVTVVDIAEESILLRNRLAKKRDSYDLCLEKEYIFALDFPNRHFDLVILDAVIQVF